MFANGQNIKERSHCFFLAPISSLPFSNFRFNSKKYEYQTYSDHSQFASPPLINLLSIKGAVMFANRLNLASVKACFPAFSG